MSFLTGKFRIKTDQRFARKAKGPLARARNLGIGIDALRRAVVQNQTSVVRINGRRVAIVPLFEHPHLERFLEQEEEKKLDRFDVEAAERILNDPDNATIPYEQARSELGLGGLPD